MAGPLWASDKPFLVREAEGSGPGRLPSALLAPDLSPPGWAGEGQVSGVHSQDVGTKHRLCLAGVGPGPRAAFCMLEQCRWWGVSRCT